MLNICWVLVVLGRFRFSLWVLVRVRLRFFWCRLMWKFGLKVFLIMCLLCISRICEEVKLFISVLCILVGLVLLWVVNSRVLVIVWMFSVMMIWLVILVVWLLLLLLMWVMFLFIVWNSGRVCLKVFG